MLRTAKNIKIIKLLIQHKGLSIMQTTGTKADIGRSSYKASGIYKSWAMSIIYSKAHWSLVRFICANEIKVNFKDKIQRNFHYNEGRTDPGNGNTRFIQGNIYVEQSAWRWLVLDSKSGSNILKISNH